jgi:hypothetical protein
MAGIGRNLFDLSFRIRGMIEGHKQLKSYVTNYYRYLFEEGNFSKDEARTDDVPQVSDEENNLLATPYSEDEVRKATF